MISFFFFVYKQEKHGPVGLVHVDAHSDTNDVMFGEKITHGTTFRRAVEEGLLDCDRVVQIGLRGSGYTGKDYAWAEDQVQGGKKMLITINCIMKEKIIWLISQNSCSDRTSMNLTTEFKFV